MVKALGKDPKFVYTVSCDNCAEQLEYFGNETTTKSYHDYGGGTDFWTYVTCPICNHKVEV